MEIMETLKETEYCLWLVHGEILQPSERYFSFLNCHSSIALVLLRKHRIYVCQNMSYDLSFSHFFHHFLLHFLHPCKSLVCAVVLFFVCWVEAVEKVVELTTMVGVDDVA